MMFAALILPLAAFFFAETETVRISGSSTAAPILSEAADDAGLEGGVIVQSTGTVEGIEELCRHGTASIIGASRRMNEAERSLCHQYGHRQLAEIEIGLSGIILAQSGRGRGLPLDLRDLYLAAAAYVPDDDSCVLVPNPNNRWRDLDPSMPDRPIRFFGPPASSGTRQVFIDRALAEGARQIDCLAELERQDPAAFERAIVPRHDEAWLDAGENEDAIAAALHGVHDAIGIFGLPSFERTQGLNALPLEGVVPSRGTILSGAYPLSHPLYLYADPEALAEPSVRRLVRELAPQGTAGGVKVYTTGSRADLEGEGPEIRRGRRVYSTP